MTSQTDSIGRSKFLLFGLLINCPFLRAKTDCPLHEFRCNPSLERKFHYLDGLEEENLEEMIAHHEQCYSRRSKGLFLRQTVNGGGERWGRT